MHATEYDTTELGAAVERPFRSAITKLGLESGEA
jgi:hypothetical protein